MFDFSAKRDNIRAVHIDALRIIACLMVIFNHTNDRGFYRYALDDIHSVIWCFDTFFSAACKAGVPLFFMISGANLIGKTESYAKTFSRAKRILLCLIIWSLLYFFIDLPPQENFLITALQKTISGNYWHLWYLYAYIAFLFTLPILRKLCANIEIHEFYLLLALGIVFTFAIPLIESVSIVINWSFKPSWITSNIFLYPAIGYYLDKKIDKSIMTKKLITILWVINIISFVLAEFIEWNYLLEHSGNKRENIIITTSIINAVTIFTTVKYFIARYNISDFIKTCVNSIGKLTFGVYLSHIIFLWKIPSLLSFWTKIESIIGGGYIS